MAPVRAVQLWWLLPVGLLGLGLRWWVLGTTSGHLTADEAYSGLQSMAIVNGDRPIVIRGIGYTAVVDSYVFAPFIWIFGAHVIPLKLLTSLWWAIAAVIGGLAVRDITSRNGAERPNVLGAITGSAMWLTPGALMIVSTRAWQAYGLLMLASTFTLWAGMRVAGQTTPDRRWSALAGGSAGAAFFLHPMTLAAVVPILAVTTAVHIRAVRNWWLPAAGAGIIVNLPFLAWNIKNGWLSLSEPSPPMDSYVERLGRFFSGLLPRAFGAMDVSGEWTFGWLSIASVLGVGALVVAGVTSAVRSGGVGWVLASACLVVWPVLALFSTVWFVADGRYAIVAFPSVVMAAVWGGSALWSWASGQASRWRQMRFLARSLVSAVAVAWVVVLGLGWIEANAGPRVADPNLETTEVIRLLDGSSITHAAGNYWNVTPIEYLSNGRIRVAVAGHPWGAILEWRPRLPWGVFFPNRQVEVAARPDAEVAFVFASNDEQVEALRMSIDRYERHVVGSSVVYVPIDDRGSASAEPTKQSTDHSVIDPEAPTEP